jgi:CelD/BcsL family acetyltransferase involved in cellulose biosynthesis
MHMTEFQFVVGADVRHAIGPEWDALYARCGAVAPSMSGAALRAFLNHRLPRDHRAVAVLASVSGTLIGGLVLMLSADQWRLRYIHAHAVGDVEAHPADALIDPLASPDLPEKMLAFLFATEPRLFSVVFPRLSPTSPVLRAPMGQTAYRRLERTASSGSLLHVPHEVGELHASLSGNFRKNLRKQAVRLQQLGEVEAQFVRAEDCTSAHIESVFALEAAGWKGREGTAIASNGRDLAYYRELAAGLKASGYLEIHLLRVHDTVLAAHLAVRVGRTLTLLKIAYNEAFSAVGPGNMLLLELLRRESASHESTIVDCITDMPWHANWRMAQRPYRSALFYPRRLVPTTLGYGVEVTVAVLRHSLLARRLIRSAGGAYWARKLRWLSGAARHGA